MRASDGRVEHTTPRSRLQFPRGGRAPRTRGPETNDARDGLTQPLGIFYLRTVRCPARRYSGARERVALALWAAVATSCTSVLAAPDAAGADATDDAARPPIAERLRVDEIVLTQGVEIALVRGGLDVAPRNAPAVALREGLVRVLVTPLAGTVTVHAELEVAGAAGTERVLASATLTAPSDRLVLGTTLDLPLRPGLVETDTTIAITITVDGATGSLRWPERGAFPLGAESALGPLRVAFVPVVSRGVAPSLGPVELDAYRTRLVDLLPIAQLDLSVLAPMTFDGDLCVGAEWPNLRRAILARRAADAPPDGVFYAGVVALADFHCTGLGGIAASGLDDPRERALAVYGIDPATTRDSPSILAHELAHLLGRMHAPCGMPLGPDPAYPYPSSLIGVTGWSAARDRVFDPTLYTDITGYCAPRWISDYTYAAVFDAIVHVHATEAAP